MNYSTIQFHPGPRIASIVLNRPPLNIINLEMLDELNAAWSEVEDLKAQVAVLSGAGERAFSAGVDSFFTALRPRREPITLLLTMLGFASPGMVAAGVLERGRAETLARSDAIMDMDALPYPEFDGYFADLAATSLAGAFDPHLVFETSRGCWWGAKHHCTFCGLNGDTMAFRSKAPGRAFAEIKHLKEQYRVKKLGCVDNILRHGKKELPQHKYVKRRAEQIAKPQRTKRIV